jgi:hypothetical protein
MIAGAKRERRKRMRGKLTEPSESARQLREVLLGYLQAAGSVTAWPGGDGLTLENILDCYPEGVAGEEVPDWQELLRRHPELETELQTWMAAKDRWQFAFRRRAEPRRADHKDAEAQTAKQVKT